MAPGPDADLTRQREVVDAFLAASREGAFEALVAVLAADVVVRADRSAVGASTEVRSASAVAEQALFFSRRARSAHPALVNGAVGLVAARHQRPFLVLRFTITHGKIVEIDVIADPDRLRRLDLAVLDD